MTENLAKAETVTVRCSCDTDEERAHPIVIQRFSRHLDGEWWIPDARPSRALQAELDDQIRTGRRRFVGSDEQGRVQFDPPMRGIWLDPPTTQAVDRQSGAVLYEKIRMRCWRCHTDVPAKMDKMTSVLEKLFRHGVFTIELVAAGDRLASVATRLNTSG